MIRDDIRRYEDDGIEDLKYYLIKDSVQKATKARLVRVDTRAIRVRRARRAIRVTLGQLVFPE